MLHRSLDEGVTWETISPDLTAREPEYQTIPGTPITRDITGEEVYSSIYAMIESRLEKGVIVVGANDGPVSITRDNGKTWKRVTPPDMGPGGRIQTVEDSPHAKGTFYVAAYRFMREHDLKPYIYKTANYGETWTKLTDGSNGIPIDHPTRVVREDPKRQGLLYAGTEFGAFVSFNDGRAWQPLQQNLPATPITDIKVHRDDLVISTMGRGLWIMDDVTPLQQLAARTAALPATHLFQPKDAIRDRWVPTPPSASEPEYSVPGPRFDLYFAAVPTDATLEIKNAAGTVVRTFAVAPPRAGGAAQEMRGPFRRPGGSTAIAARAGMQRFTWDMRYPGRVDGQRSGRRPRRAAGRAWQVLRHADGGRPEPDTRLRAQCRSAGPARRRDECRPRSRPRLPARGARWPERGAEAGGERDRGHAEGRRAAARCRAPGCAADGRHLHASAAEGVGHAQRHARRLPAADAGQPVQHRAADDRPGRPEDRQGRDRPLQRPHEGAGGRAGGVQEGRGLAGMPTREITLDYDDEQVSFTVEGEAAFGAPTVLLDGDDNLIAGRPWADAGFVVAPFLRPEEFQRLAEGIRLTLRARIAATGIAVANDFALERYHEAVTTDEAHAAVSARGPWCHAVGDLGVPVATISQRVSEILGLRVSTTPPHSEFPEHFCYRVVRPRSRDNNPPHRDVWLDRLRHAVNIYVPFAGSTPRSSLPLVPGSHRWKESEIERTGRGRAGQRDELHRAVGGGSGSSPGAGPARSRLERGARVLAVSHPRRRLQPAAGPHASLARDALLARRLTAAPPQPIRIGGSISSARNGSSGTTCDMRPVPVAARSPSPRHAFELHGPDGQPAIGADVEAEEVLEVLDPQRAERFLAVAAEDVDRHQQVETDDERAGHPAAGEDAEPGQGGVRHAASMRRGGRRWRALPSPDRRSR